MSGDLPLTPDDVAEIVAILDGSAYERLEIRTSRFSLRVARAGGGWTQEWEWDAPPAASASAAPASAAPAEAGDRDAPAEIADGLLAIRPPLPGTFYRAPQPGAPPFVEAGDAVEPETVVAIIETMKLMNPVHAGVRGTIHAILHDNAAPVEADAVLMTVRPAG
jgi:acetyl-CoA carboxylase biotin carboxyl carrier protein